VAQFSSELDKMLRVCTVRLRVGHGGGQGPGFFVAPGLILTCAHVVEAAQPNTKPVQVKWNGQNHTAKIQTCLAKPYPDLALLCLDLQHHPCAYLYQEVSLRDPLYSYGYTDKYSNGDSATFEYEGPTDEEQTLLKLKEGQACPGLSGAPLLNLRTGAVCGIVKSTRDRSSDLGARAIPISTVLSRLSDLANLQQRFHQQDKRWLGCLTSEQWRWVPWKTAVVHNPFYGESPHLLGRSEEIRRIQEKLQAGNHCSIVGPHGSGKSLLLKEIIQQIPSWLGCQPYAVYCTTNPYAYWCSMTLAGWILARMA
jgi:ABC-type multidrug transport system fused ATPase/permease subunit